MTAKISGFIYQFLPKYRLPNVQLQLFGKTKIIIIYEKDSE
jgi:hypothetical protein